MCAACTALTTRRCWSVRRAWSSTAPGWSSARPGSASARPTWWSKARGWSLGDRGCSSAAASRFMAGPASAGVTTMVTVTTADFAVADDRAKGLFVHHRQNAGVHARREGNAMNRVPALTVVIALAAFAGLSGCFKPPEIVMVDRATALEQQAAGSFDDLERKLDRAGIEPRPVPLTPEQLETLGIRPRSLVDESELTDADRLDGLLAQHCVGEGKDGLIVDTRDACRGAADAEQVQTLAERANRA